MTTIRTRRGTAAQWSATNPVLALGELGLETDTAKLKGGDGVTAWSSLPYISAGGGGGGGVTDHGALTGLSDDDHPHYFNQTRGDARYPLISDLTSGLSGKSNTGHSHVIDDVTGLQAALDGKQASGSYAASTHSHTISDVTGLSAAISAKQDMLVSGTSIKTVNGSSLLGSGDLAVSGSTNLDGGSAASTYGGSTTIDGGGASG